MRMCGTSALLGGQSEVEIDGIHHRLQASDVQGSAARWLPDCLAGRFSVWSRYKDTLLSAAVPTHAQWSSNSCCNAKETQYDMPHPD